ncbi:MAG: DUF4292 domain-containing protein [Sphingobacteriales bacterium]|nr:MAG: DUF4292 domain-containing protein [Sphingobacteriales bacterium]
MRKLFTYGLLILITVLASCRSQKKIQKAIAPKTDSVVVIVNEPKIDTLALVKDAIGKMNSYHIDFKTFSAKIKVDYQNNKGRQPDFTANIRMKKDEVIWISLTGTLGIEGFRVKITPDSIYIMDKLANTYTVRTLSYLQEISQIPLDFATLQNMIVGNPVFFNSDSISAYRKDATSNISLLSITTVFKHLLTLSNDDLITHSKLDDQDPTRNRTCDLTYEEYENKNGVNFSTYRNIVISEKSKLEIQLKFKQFDFNPVDQTYPFNVPKRFTRK